MSAFRVGDRAKGMRWNRNDEPVEDICKVLSVHGEHVLVKWAHAKTPALVRASLLNERKQANEHTN
jgi:hypothetical protein